MFNKPSTQEAMVSLFESKPTPENILSWLARGCSCVLYIGRHRAYLTDEDDDCGWQPIPVMAAHKLVAENKVTVGSRHRPDEIYPLPAHTMGTRLRDGTEALEYRQRKPTDPGLSSRYSSPTPPGKQLRR